ncbi:putative uncharacterized protein [Clostridium sp. CAG:921]|nr:putative uncharacterized protein [Clostridium sp. CAG:921]
MKESVRKSIKRKEILISLKRLYNFLMELLLLTVGSYLVSLGINLFLLPHKMSTGGASGIATMLYYTFNIPLGVTILVLNLPLLLISILKLGRNFTIKTIYSTVILSLFLEMVKYNNILTAEVADLQISCIFGGIVSGIGLSLIFRTGASSGGSDLLAQIIYKFTKFQSLSQILLVIESTIIFSTIVVFKDLNIGLYSIIAMFISTKMIDLFFEGVNSTKVATIITSKGDAVVIAILRELKRGATITNSIGAHTGNANTKIDCVISRQQISKLKSIIRENDSDALMYIVNANEAIGNGFKSIE